MTKTASRSRGKLTRYVILTVLTSTSIINGQSLSRSSFLQKTGRFASRFPENGFMQWGTIFPERNLTWRDTQLDWVTSSRQSSRRTARSLTWTHSLTVLRFPTCSISFSADSFLSESSSASSCWSPPSSSCTTSRFRKATQIAIASKRCSRSD